MSIFRVSHLTTTAALTLVYVGIVRKLLRHLPHTLVGYTSTA